MGGFSRTWPTVACAIALMSLDSTAQEPIASPQSAASSQAKVPGDGASPGVGGVPGPGVTPGSMSGPDGPGGASGAAGDLFGPGGAGAGAGGIASGLGGVAASAGGPPNMIGDISPLVAIRAVSGLPQPPPIPPPNQPSSPSLPGSKIRSQLAPSVRGFKIADNQSPFPQDRVFYSFNYFNDINAKLDRYFASPFNQLSVYRELIGFEKTFNDAKGSFGVRLPINTIHANTSPGLIHQGGQSTAVGNATFFAKYILEYNPKTGNLFSVGLAITPPTGPGRFAGAKFLGGRNNTTVQPFVGYYLNLTDRLFLQGFSAIDVPVDYTDVTLVYNDLGLGYYAFRDPDGLVSAVVPTVEVHVNTPLNHRAAYSFGDASGTADSVNITSGLSVEIRRKSLFTLGVVAPVTGPRPFNVEAVALLNYRFGGPRRPRGGAPTPVIGG